MTKTLLIGYGNPLRADDGAGQKVAEAFSLHKSIKAIACHQLTPELALDLAQAERVYFVDAAPVPEVTLESISPQENGHQLGHFMNPQALLGLTQKLYQACPDAYLVLVPAQNFTLGETLSTMTQKAITFAIQLLQERLEPCVQQGSTHFFAL